MKTDKLNDIQKEILQRWQKKQKNFITQEVKDTLKIKFGGEVFFDEPMSRHSYMHIGGKADVFLKPHSKEALVYVVKYAQEKGIPYCFHGAGANTLIKDGGIRGFVISTYDCLKDYAIVEKTDDYIDVQVDSGMHFSRLVSLCKENGIADVVSMVGIPGSVGGLVKMNAGTPVREIKDMVRQVAVLTKDAEEKVVSREHLDFEYRQLKLPRTVFILQVLFRFQDLVSSEEVEALMKQYQGARAEKQPLDHPSLGSIFKNPQPTHKNEVVPTAGQLIEEAGLKNIRIGGARISQKHGNFIINENKASAADILALVGLIKDKVKQMSGIVLETEIKIIGEDTEE